MAVEVKLAPSSCNWEEGRPLAGRPSPPDSVVFNSFQRVSKPRVIDPDWAIFNSAVYHTREADYFIARAVYRPDVSPGVPDRNVLVVVKSNRNGVFERQLDFNLPIGEQDGEVMNWEDPRIDGDIMGLTAVCKEGSSYVAYPALVKIRVNGQGIEAQSKPVILRQDRGKNVVPAGDEFVYRREGDWHMLRRGLISQNGTFEEVGVVDFRDFSDIKWGRKKIGVVTRRIPIGDGLYMLPIHGVSESTEFDDIYSVGLSVVDENWKVLAVDPEPLIKRDHYSVNLPKHEDLDSRKDVVYASDFRERDGKITFLVNVGDRITVLTDFWKSYLESRSRNFLSYGERTKRKTDGVLKTPD